MQMKNNLLRISLNSGFAFALAFAAWLPGTAHAQDATKPMKPMKGGEHQMMLNAPAQADGMEMMKAKMMERCQAMKEQKQKMKEDMKAQDAELTQQLTEMNRAPADKKTDLMAAVLTHMVDLRIAMDARKAKMEEEMMQHMMEHMQMGKESMAQCPMMKGMKDMKGMKGMDKKSGAAHKEHQPEQK